MRLVTIDDIRAAAERIRGSVVRTPLIPAPWGDPERPLWLKPENLQAVGAFKVRGAFNAIARLDEATRARGVVAYSSGNHAQAVAYAAAKYGISASIVMPEETPAVKITATRSHGAEVVLCAAGERERVADEVVSRTGGVLIPPFDHPDVIAGRAPSVWRSSRTCRRGPMSSSPSAAPASRRVSAPRSRRSRHGPRSSAWNRNSPVTPRRDSPRATGSTGRSPTANRTIADGLRSQPSALTFAHLQKLLDGVITVSENEIRDAVREIALRAHLVAEPSGATALAAYRRGPTPTGPTVVIVSGGNVESTLLAEILTGSPGVHQG